MKLNELRDCVGARKARKRICRGIGSGRGKTGGRGGKGQTARSGVSIHGFEGGQTPLRRRLPKRGFCNIFKKRYAEVNLSYLQKALDAGLIKSGQELTQEDLRTMGLVRRLFDGVKILARGELKEPLVLKGFLASKAAREAVEKSGGRLEIAPSA